MKIKKRQYFVWEESCGTWCYAGLTLDKVEERIKIEEENNKELEEKGELGLVFKVNWMTDLQIEGLPEL